MSYGKIQGYRKLREDTMSYGKIQGSGSYGKI